MSERLPVSGSSEKKAMRFSWSAAAILSFPMAFLYVGYAMGFEDFRLMTYRNPAVVIFTLLYLFLVSHGANRLDRPASRESRLWAGMLADDCALLMLLSADELLRPVADSGAASGSGLLDAVPNPHLNPQPEQRQLSV